MESKRVGDILLETGLIDDQQLRQALAMQAGGNKRLGEILLDLGCITEQLMVEVLEFQLGIPRVQLHQYRVNPAVINALPKRLVEKYLVFPLGKKDSKILVAMADPLNYFALEEIQMSTGLQPEVYLTTMSELEAAIKRYYSLQDSARELGATAGPDQGVRLEDEAVTGSPVARAVNNILRQAVEAGASDIHLDPREDGMIVRFRVDGVMRNEQVFNTSSQGAVIARLKVVANLNVAEHRLPQDGRLEMTVGNHRVDVRVSILPTIDGEKVVLRLLDRQGAVQVHELGFSPLNEKYFQSFISSSYGAVLITGPTGSGKTTTLYAALQQVNREDVNIITVEDPVEYRLTGINQVQVNPAIGLTFAGGLRAILRQDPNIIMVGEIRDPETALISMRSAITGHLVLSTLHTNDTATSLTRLMDMEVEPFMVASAVVGVVAQRLVRRVCPTCAAPYSPSSQEKELLAKHGLPADGLKKGTGCQRCGRTGYLGRTGIHEVMAVDDEIRSLVLRRSSAEGYRRHREEKGSPDMLADGLVKAGQGLTTFSEILRVAGGI